MVSVAAALLSMTILLTSWPLRKVLRSRWRSIAAKLFLKALMVQMSMQAAFSRKRSSLRQRVLKRGVIAFANITVECTVRNLSESGACVLCEAPIPNDFDLTIATDPTPKKCLVMWRHRDKIGVAFS
jgi:hypothetical protein